MRIKPVLVLAVAGQGVHLWAQETPAPVCDDPSDPDDLRLWDDTAPGVAGTDPCADIPFDSATDIAIVVCPGGGYNDLADQEEQAPVGQYFANRVGITAFVLYYRLLQKDGTYRYPLPMFR